MKYAFLQLTCAFFLKKLQILRCQKCSTPFSIFWKCCQKMLKEPKYVNLIHKNIKLWNVMYYWFCHSCITDFAICFNVYLKCSLTCLLDSCRILAWCLVQPLSGCGASIDLTLFSNRSNSLYGGHHEWPSEYQDFATGPVLPSLMNSTIRYMFFWLQQPRAP